MLVMIRDAPASASVPDLVNWMLVSSTVVMVSSLWSGIRALWTLEWTYIQLVTLGDGVRLPLASYLLGEWK